MKKLHPTSQFKKDFKRYRRYPDKVSNFEKVAKIEMGMQDKKLFEKLGDSNIWELRTLFDGMSYRLFSFWDTDINALVVATHGIVKKTQKTPPKEIAKAERIRLEYFKDKTNV